jgi:peptidoglycan/xylan/chitin deacetylase (PgdA/CDA1 family)
MELAVAGASEIEQEWREQVTDGIEYMLSWFDHVPLTDPAAEALAAARRHLQDAQAQIRSLTAEFLAANPNHGTEA